MSVGFVTAADLQHQLGGIPLERIRVVPPPGLATDDDAMQVQDREGRTCEVIDGVLVEKAMGFYEARVAAAIVYFLETYLRTNDLGIVLGPDGLVRISASQSRAPDVTFARWDKFPNRRLPAAAVPTVIPDLAVEVLSRGNTRSEMEAKLDDYFAAGVQSVWLIEPLQQTAKLYSSRDIFSEIQGDGVLVASSVLPGFELPLNSLFDHAGKRGEA
jgi:Uma2 family endonuclease